MRTVAPAKINWTLEVLRRRPDGYHDVRSVMQTIDLCDEVWADRSDELRFETTAGEQLVEDDLIVRAAGALEARSERPLPARVRVEKRIPIASGLGGGSSDAAATLRLLNRLHDLGLSEIELAEVGAGIGSDVPFFVFGGTALVEGRGERVTPLPDASNAWFTIVVPRINLRDKTRAMYRRLAVHDYTDGSATEWVRAAIAKGVGVNEFDTFNVFDRYCYDVVEGMKDLGLGLFAHELLPVHAVGSGPSIFVYCDEETPAVSLSEYAMAFTFQDGAEQSPDSFWAETFVARALGRTEATDIVE